MYLQMQVCQNIQVPIQEHTVQLVIRYKMIEKDKGEHRNTEISIYLLRALGYKVSINNHVPGTAIYRSKLPIHGLRHRRWKSLHNSYPRSECFRDMQTLDAGDFTETHSCKSLVQQQCQSFKSAGRHMDLLARGVSLLKCAIPRDKHVECKSMYTIR